MDVFESTESTRTTVAALYALYKAGDIERAAAGLSEDVDWAIMAPPHLFAFAGARRGRTAVLAAFRQIAQSYEFLAYDITSLIADGDRACVTVECVVRDRKSGAGVTLQLCDVMQVKGGQIVWLREFMDAADVALVLAGAGRM